jgi:poly(3-hydroxybutyrate) depolymerase
LKPRAEKPAGDLVTFDQKPFTSSANGAGMASDGAVYIPSACRKDKGCRVHVAFHGCGQNRAAVSDAFVSGTGFAAWADSNRLIILFPQAEADLAVNPLGCWDWWGYTGFQYLTRDAPQITAVHAMVTKLTSKP